jgi:glycosyltransferase involved in cell wall biosynthesis
VSGSVPRVSVVMSVRDVEPYVAAAIGSLLAQTFDDFELLVFDDGSTDATPEIVEALAARDPRIRLERRVHGNYVDWLNEGIRDARGQYVARMDGDDVARPERFACQVAHLDAHPDCVAVGSEVLYVDPDGRPLRLCGVPLDHAAIDAQLLAGRGCALVQPAAMLRTSALRAVGGYRPERNCAEDIDLFLRLAERGRLANRPEVLLDYRERLSGQTARRTGDQRRGGELVLAETRARRGLAGPAPVLAGPERLDRLDCWHRWTREAIGGGFRTTARHYAWRVVRAAPLELRSWRLLARALLGIRLRRPTRIARENERVWNPGRP